jgi:pimeloyl-ACP methyl ester carboxylesterase
VRSWTGAGLAALLGTLALAGQASAQVSVGECEGRSLRGAECGSIGVPLNHADPTPPPQARSISLGYVRFRARQARRGTIVFIAGGPGESAVRDAGAIANRTLAPLRNRYDIVVFDQRGTGVSSPLRCSVARAGQLRIPAGATPAETARVVNRCATEIGTDRQFFSTYETAMDIEDLRAFLGVPKIIPLGVSYGGQVAGEYARRYPERVAALVLDSTSPIEGVDALARLPQLALPRVLREVCFPPGCEAFLGDPVNLLRGTVDRLGRAPLRGTAVLPSGRKRSARITLADLYALIRSSDADPLLRTALPAALDAAVRGDAAPLLRLLVQGEQGGGRSSVNEIRFLATACTEGRLPWDPTSDPASRPALLDQALAAGRADYAPFPVEVVAPLTDAAQCLGWPETPRPPFVPSPAAGPDVPVLVLGGREDLRTPLEDQRRAASQFPNARVVGVANAGHSVLSNDTSGCGIRAVRVFLSGAALAPSCGRLERAIPLALPVFRRLDQLPGAAGTAPRDVERTVVAVDLTLRDVVRQLAAIGIGSSSGADVTARTISVGGLRGGRLVVTRRGVRLVSYEVVPGVRVSGALSPGGRGQLTITGRAATGSLALRASGLMTGTLDGVTIRYRPTS